MHKKKKGGGVGRGKRDVEKQQRGLKGAEREDENNILVWHHLNVV